LDIGGRSHLSPNLCVLCFTDSERNAASDDSTRLDRRLGSSIYRLGVVVLLSVSPWHLLWWIPVGYILTMIVARLLVLAGFRKHLGL